MKIYFCGAITGGRIDQPIYAELIEHLKRYGSVLTEHVGDPTITEFDQEGPAPEIYSRDEAWLRQADVVIAEVTVPSHGVGVELAHAEALGKPVLCLFRQQPSRPVSPFVSGNPYFTLKTYHDVDEAKRLIDEYLEERKNAG